MTKKFLISLTILISGKKSPTNKNIDVFLEPLLEELLELWEGVPTYDASAGVDESKTFLLRGLFLWTFQLTASFQARKLKAKGRVLYVVPILTRSMQEDLKARK